MNKAFLILIVVSIMFSNTLLAQKDKELFDESIEFYNNDKPKKALTLINDAIKINDKVSNYHILKGKILYEINEDVDELFIHVNTGISVEPNSPMPLLTRAEFYEQLLKFQDAIMDYNDALKLAQHDSIKISVYNNRGKLYSKLQKPEIGYEDLMKAYQIDSTDEAVLNNLAICLDRLGKPEESYQILLKATRLKPNFTPNWVNLGFQASLRGKYKDAVIFLNKADSLSPNEPFALNNRGYAKFKLKDYKGALKDINRSIELDPSNSYAYRNKALVYIEKKDLEIACENLYLSQKKGFSLYYGEEVNELIKTHCIK